MKNFKVKSVIVDIEGTIGSFAFVKDTLFPYASEKLPEYLAANWRNGNVKALVAEVARLEGETGLDAAGTTEILRRWIREDKKATPLKALQGLMWEDGYKSGVFKGHIYQDSYDKIKSWVEAGIPVYVYSSGSVHAQKLLFGFSCFGDITGLFSGFFDTTIGGKLEKESYLKISAETGIAPEKTLFFSDNLGELDAAADAGMHTLWINRYSSVYMGRHDEEKDFSRVVVEKE